MSAEAKENILNAAEKEFSAKGFDGARVDRIAEVAGVNKALIYYYFKGKKELLKALYERLVKDGFQSFDLQPIADSNLEGMEEETHKAFHRILSFLNSHRDILRIILMESLKQDGENLILDLADLYMGQSDIDISEYVVEPNLKQYTVNELFTALFPTIMYSLFRDDVGQRLSADREEMDHLFMKGMMDTHFRTHKSK